MSKFTEKVKVLASAVPVWGAAVTSALTGLSASLVPVLPVDVGVKVAALVAAAVGWVATAVAVVSRVTPILFAEDKGLLPVEQDEFVNAVGGFDDWGADAS